MDQTSELELSQEFVADYERTIKELEGLVLDLFQGYKIERVAKNLLERHKDYLMKFPFCDQINTKYPNLGYYETLDDDLVILRSEFFDPKKIPKYAQILCIVYSYASAGTYLRASYNYVMASQNDNRKEAVDLARMALRYNPIDRWSNYFYGCSIGFHLTGIKNPKERIMVGRNYKYISKRLIRLLPEESLGYNLLGRYNYHAGNVNWLEKQVWKQLLSGDKIDEPTQEETEELFLKSYELKKDWLSNPLWIARLLVAQKRPMEEVKKWIDIASACKPMDPLTVLEERELQEFKNKLKISN